MSSTLTSKTSPGREAERYNHKPVIDLLVYLSRQLSLSLSLSLVARVPAGYRGGALKFSEPSMHELFASRASSPITSNFLEFRQIAPNFVK